MPFRIVHGDILTCGCAALINPSDERLSGSGGLDRQIHEAAGPELEPYCRRLTPICPGQAVATAGFEIGASYIIHTAAPWYTGRAEEVEGLRRCYRSSFALAARLGLSELAFPLIGSGTRGFPKELVLRIATEETAAFLRTCEDMEAVLVVHDREQYQPDPRLLSGVGSFLRRSVPESFCAMEDTAVFAAPMAPTPKAASPERRCTPPKAAGRFRPGKEFRPDESFSRMVLRKIDEKGMSDPECYHRANMDRRLFSRLRSQSDYQPKKTTAVALAIALKLSLEETRELLDKAGYSLSPSLLFDQIIEYCLREGIYDIFVVNALLFQYDQSLLG